ncbi:coagulation factor V isoform X2 [Clinocottus analis]|uniref:coagulation factor V isoform X2 n=1 Tax=Clinocottus analis TaxID=304258 RepID=UPI0035BF37D6
MQKSKCRVIQNARARCRTFVRANYFDNTSKKEKEDDVVQPNGEHVYYWEVTSDVSPQPHDPNCLTYTYVSHINVVEDYNSGLIGALLVCKNGSLDESGQQVGVHQEYVFLFGVFDERESKYKPDVEANHLKHTINGYTMGSLPDVCVCAYAWVSLHLVGMSSEAEIFSVHMNGQVLQQNKHKVSSVGLISGTTATASMVALHEGRWLLSSQTVGHVEAGIYGFVDVKKCDGFKAPYRRMTVEEKRNSRVWTYYIAAEEIIWDYAPEMPEHIDGDFKLQYLKQSSTRIGGKYKKAVYTLYTNSSFTEKLEDKQKKKEVGISGPVIRAQIRDIIKIVFKNMASRPYSIYPHGLTLEKPEEGVNYPAGGNQSHGVQPGETHTYRWSVVDEDEPFDEDSRCLTRLYHSAVDTQRDIASGLIGQILICKSQSLNKRGVQMKADKEQHAMFAVFDENKSWYLEDNIRQYCDRSKVNRADPDFYKSNVMHTINGYVYESGHLLGFCNGEIVTWHVSSIGAQDYIQTVTFYGHTFELNGRTEDFLSLYPMNGETITMNMDNIGVWLMASLNSHETTKGMRVKFQDVECYRDHQYEYSDYDDPTALKEFIEWNPLSWEEIKKEEEVPKPVKKPTEPDLETDMYANLLGLRSHRNQSSKSDVDVLDLSFLDYDAIDVPAENTNTTFHFKKAKNKNQTHILEANELNETLFANLTEVDGLNLTAVNLLNQSIGENTTHFSNSTMRKIVNTTIFHSQSILPKNDSITANSSAPVVSKNITAHNAAVSSMAVNVSTENTNLTVTLQETANLTETLIGNSSSIMEPEGMNVTLTGGNQTSVGTTLVEDSKERLTRGDVFMYSAPLSNTSTNNHSTPEGNATSWSDVGEVNISSIDRSNMTILEVDVERTDNKTSDNDSLIATEEINYWSSLEVEMNSSDISANASLENVTHTLLERGPLQDVTANLSRSNSSEEISSESRENITALLGELNRTSSAESSSNETNLSPSSDPKELSALDSVEEVLIYLSEDKTEVIKTTSVKTLGHNWTYEGTHQMEIMEISDDMMKYFGQETAQTKPTPKKKTRKVNRRQWPNKGQGMKTKKRKEYKPQTKEGLPFSPRGFNPGMNPRGARPPQPVSDEAELVNKPVVIGVPRYEFTDYELYIPGDEPSHIENVNADEYDEVNYKDPYSGHEDIKNLNVDEAAKHYLKLSGPNVKTYFIAAEEVEWDYRGYGQRRPDKSESDSRVTKFTKAVFRGYMDSSFSTRDIRGELDEHLGILGPVIKAEVGQSIMVVFKNLAKRPYSLHPNGVSYTKHTEGLSYEDGSQYWFKYDNEVQPNTTFTYIWKVTAMVGPLPDEADCRTWAYYSGVNPERDINSGLIGPLLVCREGSLDRKVPDMREFTMLFMTFDESQSWYYKKNHELMQRRSRSRFVDHNLNLKFHAINGIIYGLKGLRMYTNRLVCWYLINMGSPKDFQSIHFHGQTFIHKKINSYRQAVYPLLPGSFATLEMYPSKPGLWQLETEVGFNQQLGMQTLFLVLDDDCYRPLGVESGSVKDTQITAINTRGSWKPHLARLNNQGKYNAWSTDQSGSWIQVDFQRPVVLSQVATQGARQLFHTQYVEKYFISYSTDRRNWIFYKGDSRNFRKEFSGNQEAYDAANTNTLFPPVVGRFVRLHPISWHNAATVRMEFYGCELDGCSVPLGMESGLIEDHRITASSIASNWYSGPWKPSLARLNQQGTVNAWRAKNNDMNQWLQVELPQIKKITGIITQGAKSLGTLHYVMLYSLEYSNNGIHWSRYTDDESIPFKTFSGNTNNNDHVKNYIYPPIFSRFIRIVPISWWNSLTMRIELLGCEFE